jgi:hypothetical protein
MWVSVMALLLRIGMALRTDQMAQNDRFDVKSTKSTNHIIDHNERDVVEKDAPASYLPINVPSHEIVGLLLRGATFRGGHQNTMNDCSDGSIDAQLTATKSVIKYIMNPLMSIPGNRVDVFIARHGYCRHDVKLVELYEQWARDNNRQHIFQYPASNESQNTNMRGALDVVTKHLKSCRWTYKLLIVMRHDIQLKRSILEWPANFGKLNFASECPSLSFKECINDILMTVPGDHWHAFDRIIGGEEHNCFSPSCDFGHCCIVDFLPAIGASNVGVLFPVSKEDNICNVEGSFRVHACLDDDSTLFDDDHQARTSSNCPKECAAR